MNKNDFYALAVTQIDHCANFHVFTIIIRDVMVGRTPLAI